MDDFTNTMHEVWVKTDERGRVTAVDGGVTMVNVDTATWTKIDEGDDTERYGGCQQHYVEMPLVTEDGIPRYKLDGTEITLRDETDIESDRVAMVSEESERIAKEEAEKAKPFEKLQEQIDFQNETIDDMILMIADIIGGA